MSNIEIISLVVTIICLVSFTIIFVFLFRHYFKSEAQVVEDGAKDLLLIEAKIQEAKDEKKKSKKVLRIVGKIFSYILLLGIIVLFILSLFNRISNGTVMINNQSLIVVASGSMSKKNSANTYLFSEENQKEYDLNNQFDTYDIIQIKRYGANSNKEDVNLYDVVAYKSSQNIVVIHRVIDIVKDDNGSVLGYITRGDANNGDDTSSHYGQYLLKENIIGYYSDYRIKTLGIFIIFIQSNSGIITFFAIMLCYIMYEIYSSKYTNALEKRTEELMEILKFDPNKDSIEDITQLDYEKLVFKNKVYIFEENEFVKELDYDEERDKSMKEEKKEDESKDEENKL